METATQTDPQTQEMSAPEVNERLGWGLSRDELVSLFYTLRQEHGLKPHDKLRYGLVKTYSLDDVLTALRRKNEGQPPITPPSDTISPALSKSPKYQARSSRKPPPAQAQAHVPDQEDDDEGGDGIEAGVEEATQDGEA